MACLAAWVTAGLESSLCCIMMVPYILPLVKRKYDASGKKTYQLGNANSKNAVLSDDL